MTPLRRRHGAWRVSGTNVARLRHRAGWQRAVEPQQQDVREPAALVGIEEPRRELTQLAHESEATASLVCFALGTAQIYEMGVVALEDRMERVEVRTRAQA